MQEVCPGLSKTLLTETSRLTRPDPGLVNPRLGGQSPWAQAAVSTLFPCDMNLFCISAVYLADIWRLIIISDVQSFWALCLTSSGYPWKSVI